MILLAQPLSHRTHSTPHHHPLFPNTFVIISLSLLLLSTVRSSSITPKADPTVLPSTHQHLLSIHFYFLITHKRPTLSLVSPHQTLKYWNIKKKNKVISIPSYLLFYLFWPETNLPFPFYITHSHSTSFLSSSLYLFISLSPNSQIATQNLFLSL